ncbi:MAG: hypothetical protein K0S53_1069 [Bacteroidetes bacterium]|jgi:hypothetical protein|nr:hypothetical protein [Bacteroidota bacterium]
MKRLALILIVLTIGTMAQAQVPEKKKSSPPRSRGQERAINEIGVSVKSDSKKPAKAKSAKPAAPKEEKKKEEKSKEAIKPE